MTMQREQGGAPTAVLIVLGALVLLAVALFWALDRAPSKVGALDASKRDEVQPHHTSPIAPGPVALEREAQAPASPVEVAPAQPNATAPIDAKLRLVRGRVVDTQGTGIAGVSVITDENAETPIGLTAPDGTFQVDIEGPTARLAVLSNDWTTLYIGLYDREEPGRDALVVVARKIQLSGFVLDEEEQGISAASLEIRVPMSLVGFPYPLHASSPRSFSVETDEEGEFRFEDAPGVSTLRLQTRAKGYRDDEQPVPTDAANGLLIRLGKNQGQAEVAIHGVVVHMDGTPAVGASVRFGDKIARVDERGAFGLPMPTSFEPVQPLVATKQGFQAAIWPDFAQTVENAEGFLAPVRLVLGAEALSIRGTIVDAEDQPLEKWTIGLLDPTVISESTLSLPSAEHATFGREVNVRTKTDGVFELGGLSARTYRLWAYSSETLAAIESDPIAAGTHDVVLRVGADVLWPELAGRVVARDGTPIANASVTVQLATDRSRFASTNISGATTRSADDGSFVLKNVPRRYAYLSIASDATIPKQVELEEVSSSGPFVITLMRRCNFRVENGPRAKGHVNMVVLNAEGKLLDLMEVQDGGWSSGTMRELVDGASAMYSVSEEGVQLQLRSRGQVIATREIQLSVSQPTVVRL